MSKSGYEIAAASQHVKEGEYWLEKFSGDFVKSCFPYDNNKADMCRNKVDTIKFSFSDYLNSKLIRMSNGADSRLFMILLAGLNLLLDKYTGNGNVTVGAPIFKQEKDGQFINTVLALKTEIIRDSTFKELLLKVKETIFEAVENQNYPIETLVYQLGMEDDQNSFPLFDVAILLQNVHNRDYLNNIKTNITINFNNTGAQIEGELEYNPELFEKSTIKRILSHYENLMMQAISNVNLSLKEIDTIHAAEKELILNSFNDSGMPYTADKTIHRLFEEQVRMTPDNTALQYEGQQLTYSQFNEKANRLARTLRGNGVGCSEKQSIVAIMVERSLEMVVGMMAILKAGGAYLPIDPEYPQDRKQFMLLDSGAEVLLIKGAIDCTIEFKGSVIDLESEESFSRERKNFPDSADAGSLAYIIYTSGSTGQPKGVMIEHKSIINTLVWRKEFYGFDEKDVILQIPSFSFDSSVEDIFTPLISGSRLVLVNQQNRFNIVYLQEIIKKHKTTHFLITPNLYKTLLDESPECLRDLRIVTLAGEKFTEELVKEHFCKLQNVRLINEYGPTENSICTTAYEFSSDNTRVLIGKPINNVKCYILDKYDGLCPVGVPGELCTSGIGLARGYLNRTELTAEKFLRKPVSDSVRMYRTGDLAKWLPDGNIEFLGRIDYQVKIRGFRIELGEIEGQLLTHEKVKDTVVIAEEESGTAKYLIQYFVADEKLAASELRLHMGAALPEYMIPSYFVQLDKIPLTTNGKVNRKALPKIAACDCSEAQYEEPANEIEAQLTEIWKEILDKDRIGVNDNFFDIGGHSLRATILVSRIRSKNHVNVPIQEIFKRTTIRKLAEYIAEKDKEIYSSIEPVEQREYYPSSPAQKRMYLVNKVEGIETAYNVPLAMHIDGILDRERTQEAINNIVKRHEAFRTSFYFENDELVQKVHENVEFNIEYINTEESQLKKLESTFVHTFDFKTAPLLRVMLVSLKEGKSVLMFDMHHIISDGVSMDILVREFVALYEGKQLPELKIQYKDFTVWQEGILNSDYLKKQKKYWIEVLSGELPVLNMPADYPRPPIQSFEGAKIRTRVDEETTSALMKLANDTGTTLFTVLLGAYNVLLFKYTGQEDIIVGAPIAGRTNSDIENVIGMFINMIALRNYPEGHKTFSNFLNEVGEETIKAFDNQDYQFNDLVDALNVTRDLSRSPLFDTMFALQNMEFRQSEIEGMKFVLDDIETKVSKFDITVIGIERNKCIDLIFEFATKLFKKETVERLSELFVLLLKQIAKNPDQKLADITLLSFEEEKRLLMDFNDYETDCSIDNTINELFEEQVKRSPDNTAVVFNGESLSYSQLNKKANQIASVLRGKYNVNRGDLVGIMVESSLEMITGILGIIKAGAAYVPIDPQYPNERIKYMLEDSKATTLLVDNLSSPVISECSLTVIDLNDDSLYSENVLDVENINSSSDLVYVIYTSGSTGKPKGVMVEHRSLVNLCRWHIKYYEVTSWDRSTKYAGFGFDASVWEIFPYILSGAALHIIDDSIKLDVVKLNQYFESNHITISFLPTQICEQFMDLNNVSLRKLLTGGDKLNHFIKKNYELINNYGPTENTVVTTSFVVDKGYSNIPIGKPLDNVKIYILDKNKKLLPVGVYGELCITGSNLARGYFNNPELTDEKFITNPFIPGERMYCTGDLARWLPDGNLEFGGRVDQQVKIRGNRVEIGEVEEQLSRCEGIKEAMVMAREDRGENKYLCAYLVSDNEIKVAEIKEQLSKTLPDYMIPTYFISIDKLPLTANGKIDTKALPQPDGNINTGVEYSAPDSATEEKLVEIWQEILDINKIGTNDNFFDIGGNSLLIMKVISKIYSVFNMTEDEISVMTMFKHPTIALMAKYIDGKAGSESSSFDEISNRIKKRNRMSARSESGRS